MTFTNLRWMILVAALAFLARAVFFFTLVPYNPEAQVRDGYLAIARNIVDGKGFALNQDGEPTSKRAPLPVYFFAGSLSLFGDHTLSIAIANWMLDAFSTLLLFLIALELFGNRRVAVLASMLFVLYVPGMYYSWQALSEPLFGLALYAFALSFLRAVRVPSNGRFVVAGVLLGVSALARPIMLYYIPVAVIALLWLLRGELAQRAKWALIMSAAFVVTMIPWSVRNYVVFKTFIPVNSNFGITLYHSNQALGETDFLRVRSPDEGNAKFKALLASRYDPGANFIDDMYDDIARNEALHIIGQYPDRYVLLSLARFVGMWYVIEGVRSGLAYLVLPLHAALWIFTFIAYAYRRDPWWRPGLFLITLVLYNNIGYALVQVSVRYIVPVVPFLMMFAGVVIVERVAARGLHFRRPRMSHSIEV